MIVLRLLAVVAALSASSPWALGSAATRAMAPVHQQKPMVVVIPSYNNAWEQDGMPVYQRNLNSVLDQEYSNFRIIYIDDCSPDGTGALAHAYLKTHPRGHLVTFIQNTERVGAILNRYKAFHTVPDDSIIVELDGDDWYAHSGVLARINQEYQNPDVWLTYGQYIRYPQNSIGHCKPLHKHVLENQIYRTDGYYTSMLRTYYAWLYKKIRLQDLLAGGKPIQSCSDSAIMIPMIEMAGEHCRFINEILYVVNRQNPLNTEKVVDTENWDREHRLVRQYFPKYPRLTDVPKPASHVRDGISALVIAERDPAGLQECLASLRTYARGLEAIVVLYQPLAGNRDGFELVRKKHPHILFVPYVLHADNQVQWGELLLAAAELTTASYLLVTSNQSVLTRQVDLLQCARMVEQTMAQGFYLTLSRATPASYAARKAMPPFYTLAGEGDAAIAAWQCTGGQQIWLKPPNLEMTLYKRATFLRALHHIHAPSLSALQHLWPLMSDPDGIGLCFAATHAITTK